MSFKCRFIAIETCLEAAGLQVVNKIFADHVYLDDGQLVSEGM